MGQLPPAGRLAEMSHCVVTVILPAPAGRGRQDDVPVGEWRTTYIFVNRPMEVGLKLAKTFAGSVPKL